MRILVQVWHLKESDAFKSSIGILNLFTYVDGNPSFKIAMIIKTESTNFSLKNGNIKVFWFVGDSREAILLF